MIHEMKNLEDLNIDAINAAGENSSDNSSDCSSCNSFGTDEDMEEERKPKFGKCVISANQNINKSS